MSQRREYREQLAFVSGKVDDRTGQLAERRTELADFAEFVHEFERQREELIGQIARYRAELDQLHGRTADLEGLIKDLDEFEAELLAYHEVEDKFLAAARAHASPEAH